MASLFVHIVAVLIITGDFSFQTLQEEKTYTVSDVSVKPEPPSGLEKFKDKWSKNVTYPKDAIKENIQGVVFIEFVVNKDGTIDQAAVRQGIDDACDEAALKGFNEVAKEIWKPGMRHDRPVKVKMVLPFYFRILKN